MTQMPGVPSAVTILLLQIFLFLLPKLLTQPRAEATEKELSCRLPCK